MYKIDLTKTIEDLKELNNKYEKILIEVKRIRNIIGLMKYNINLN